MPELPEVQCTRQSLARFVIGRRITQVSVRRADIVRNSCKPRAILQGCRIVGIDRHGKQLAIQGSRVATVDLPQDELPCVCVHLGMSGALRYIPAGGARVSASRAGDLRDPHIHVIWRFDDGGRMVFRDPRRFGGLWTFPTTKQLHHDRWRRLGEDALRITPKRLYRALQKTTRPIKSALLDQQIIAGLGNIYVDEILFRCSIFPLTPSNHLTLKDVQRLVFRLRAVLKKAIQSGGSTFRDYVDATNKTGDFQHQHKVYGRKNQPCWRCGNKLTSIVVVGRTTVFCPTCQQLTNTRTPDSNTIVYEKELRTSSQ